MRVCRIAEDDVEGQAQPPEESEEEVKVKIATGKKPNKTQKKTPKKKA